MSDYPITIASTRVSVLSEQEIAQTGFNVKFRILGSDIAVSTATTATDTVTMTLGTTPVNYYIDKGLVSITTAFAGTTALTLTVGTTSSTAALISSTSVLTAATLNQTVGTPIMTNLKATAAVNLVAIFTNATGGSPSAITAGQLDLYMNIQDASRLP